MSVHATDDYIYNWHNRVLSQTEKGARQVAAQTAQELQQAGYSRREAEDAMLVRGMSIPHVETALEGVYAPRPAPAFAPEESSRNAMLVPTSYREVRSFVDAALDAHAPREFMQLLARSPRPIMPLNAKSYESFVRLAERAKEDEHARECLHAELTPFLEEAMYQSVCLAQYAKNPLRLAASSGPRHIIAQSNGTHAEVNLEAGICDCPRYTEGNYRLFGLACEHMVVAADTLSPHERLMHAIHR